MRGIGSQDCFFSSFSNRGFQDPYQRWFQGRKTVVLWLWFIRTRLTKHGISGWFYQILSSAAACVISWLILPNIIFSSSNCYFWLILPNFIFSSCFCFLVDLTKWYLQRLLVWVLVDFNKYFLQQLLVWFLIDFAKCSLQQPQLVISDWFYQISSSAAAGVANISAGLSIFFLSML